MDPVEGLIMEILKSIRRDIFNLPLYVEGKSPKKGKGRIFKLSSNENPLGSSPDAMKAIGKELRKGIFQYPDAAAAGLKYAITGFWKSRSINLEQDQIVCGDSADEIISMIASTFINEGDQVIISEKSFSMYSICSISKGAVVKEVPRINFKVNLDGIAREAENSGRTKLVMFSNPDNPTSTFHDPGEIEKFLNKIPASTGILLDEAYIHFAGLENSSISMLNKFPNLMIVYTFSKVYGLAGLRVGYSVMNKEIASQMEKIRMPFNLGVLQLKGAEASLADNKFYEKTLRTVEYGKNYLSKELERLGIYHLKPYGNFIFADFGPKSHEIISHIEENGITVRTLNSFGFSENYVRISIGCREANSLLIRKLEKILKSS